MSEFIVKEEPSLQQEEKVLMMTTATHNGVTITFNEEEHSYIDNFGRKYESTTTFIHKFFPEFKALEIAEKCSKNKKKKEYFGRKPEDIVKEWEDKKNKAADFGTKIHKRAEELLLDLPLTTLFYDREIKISDHLTKFIDELLIEYKVVATEKILFSPLYLISGTLDILLKHRITGQYVICDWKTNEEIKMDNFFSKGLPPIKHLDDCNFNHYSLQLNIYDKLLTDGNYYPVLDYEKKIFHITDEGVNVIDPSDLSMEAQLLLNERSF